MDMHESATALVELGHALQRTDYRFVTPTPETHRRVFARRETARDLRDVFGWSLPFVRTLLQPALFNLMVRARAVHERGGLCWSTVRFSSLSERLFVHSAYPTASSDAVFFGPDTYRFCSFLERAAPRARTVLDIGCGSGAGGLIAARAAAAERLLLVDINTRALTFARVNAALFADAPAAVACAIFASDVLRDVHAADHGELELIIANPPYMRDDGARVYRDGGGTFGEALSVRIVREALARLAPSGTLLLYTGAATVEGRDVFFSAVRELVLPFEHSYQELDPDVFGEELERPGYENVERIAAVGLTVTKRA